MKKRVEHILVAMLVLFVVMFVMLLVFEIKVRNLETRIDSLEAQVVRHDAYLWDITLELTGDPLSGPDGNPYHNGGESRLDILFSEVWGKYYDEDPLDPDNKVYEECGYTTLKRECPPSRIDSHGRWINANDLYIHVIEVQLDELEKQCQQE